MAQPSTSRPDAIRWLQLPCAIGTSNPQFHALHTLVPELPQPSFTDVVAQGLPLKVSAIGAKPRRHNDWVSSRE